MIPFLLLLWGVAAVHLFLGRYTHIAAVVNYLFWVVFIVFTPMWQDFDGGFDQLMTGTGLLLIFLPTERALTSTSWLGQQWMRPGWPDIACQGSGASSPAPAFRSP